MNTVKGKLAESLHIVWTIASKDIVDSVRNKLIISLILGMGFMLLMPKVMGLMLVPLAPDHRTGEQRSVPGAARKITGRVGAGNREYGVWLGRGIWSGGAG